MDTVTIPPLCGAGEACEILGIPTSKLPPLRRQASAGFPEPVQVLRCGPIWIRADVEAFAARRAAR